MKGDRGIDVLVGGALMVVAVKVSVVEGLVGRFGRHKGQVVSAVARVSFRVWVV